MTAGTMYDLTAESAARAYAEAPEYNRKIADKYLFILNSIQGMNTREMLAWLANWNEEHPEERISENTVWRAKRNMRDGGAAGCLGKFGKSLGKSSVSDEAFEFFKSLYLNENRLSVGACHRLTRAKFYGTLPATLDNGIGAIQEAKPAKAPAFPRAFEVVTKPVERAYLFNGKRATVVMIGGEAVHLTPGGAYPLPENDPVTVAFISTGLLTMRGGKTKKAR